MRAIWKGHIRFSLVTIPVRIYSAIESANALRFNQLSKETKNPVGYEKKDKVTGQSLKNQDIVKGYQYEPGQYVIVEDEDFEKVKLKSTKVIEIAGFVDKSEVHPTLYESPYFAGPDGEVAAKTYALLKQTLEETGKIGVGKVVLRDRENLMLLTPHGKGLMLYKLRSPEEVRDMKDVPNIDTEAEADQDQLKLAKTLVDNMTKSFDEIDKSDRYHVALKEIIDAKIAGKEVVTVSEDEPEVVDIMTALKKSIEEAKKKPMEKAKGKKETATKKKSKQAS